MMGKIPHFNMSVIANKAVRALKKDDLSVSSIVGNSNQTGQSPSVLALVVPTFNERENIRILLNRLDKVRLTIPFDLRIVVVDDNSPDGTGTIVKDATSKLEYIHLIERPKPSGLGSAYLEGFAYGLEVLGATYVGEIDADLQHPPELLTEMCRVASSGKDVVIASRYVTGGGSRDWSLGRRFVSKGANLLAKVFLRVPVADATSGYRLISKKFVHSLLSRKVSSKGYAFQVESLYVYKKSGASFAEVPFEFEVRRAGKTKLSSKEIFRFALTVIRTGIFGVKESKEEAAEKPQQSLNMTVERPQS
jgi:dolichol-phosphate mannosyltransferase